MKSIRKRELTCSVNFSKVCTPEKKCGPLENDIQCFQMDFPDDEPCASQKV